MRSNCRAFPDVFKCAAVYDVFKFEPVAPKERRGMPRYLIERTFPDGLVLSTDEQGAQVCLTVVDNNSTEGVTWIHSYVTPDKKKTFCIYDAPSPEAIRKVAQLNNLPLDRINEVRVLDPYFHQ